MKGEIFSELILLDQLSSKLEELRFVDINSLCLKLENRELRAIADSLVNRKILLKNLFKSPEIECAKISMKFCPYCDGLMKHHRTIYRRDKKPRGFVENIQCENGFVWKIETSAIRPIFRESTNGYCNSYKQRGKQK